MKFMLGLKNETQRKVKLLNSGHCLTGDKLFMANVSISLSVKIFSIRRPPYLLFSDADID